ncbi:MAG: hypothetical protein WED04_09275 [Promethearchaeati archaeon SRVP18_Atabeyarchaeia-1]
MNEKIEDVVLVTQADLLRELANFEKELKQKLSSLQIDVEDALELYLAKRDEIEDLIEHGRRLNGKYRVKLFDESLEGLREVGAGVIQKARLDLPRLKDQELLAECSKDLHDISKEAGGVLSGLTRSLGKVGSGSKEAGLQASYLQAMTKLLAVLARQNQVVINILQVIKAQAET